MSGLVLQTGCHGTYMSGKSANWRLLAVLAVNRHANVFADRQYANVPENPDQPAC